MKINFIFRSNFNRTRLISTLLFLMILSGCIFAPERKVRTFDLGTPKSIAPEKIRLAVMPFMNNTEVDYQMMYRTGKNKVEKDAYNRWIETPGLLVTSYLLNAFRSPDNKETYSENNNYTLSGEVTLFEINLQENYVALCVSYRIQHKNKYIIEKDVTFKQTFDKPSPDKFAEAMSKAAADLSEKIRFQLVKKK
jgi:ABC-type uncharacterized transport system auxiliary subunit